MSKLVDRSLLLPSQVNVSSFSCITTATYLLFDRGKKCQLFIGISNLHQESIFIRSRGLIGLEITHICERDLIMKFNCSDQQCSWRQGIFYIDLGEQARITLNGCQFTLTIIKEKDLSRFEKVHLSKSVISMCLTIQDSNSLGGMKIIISTIW